MERPYTSCNRTPRSPGSKGKPLSRSAISSWYFCCFVLRMPTSWL